MSSQHPHSHEHPPGAHDHGPHDGPGQHAPLEPTDAASQTLSDALRRSFGVLKALMAVLIVLYALSGIFSVEQNERGMRMRFGRIIGAQEGRIGPGAVLSPGWHFGLPYPFERWITVKVNERDLPVEFLFQLSEREQLEGIRGEKYDNLSPFRDDYLITGDVNILHVSVTLRYNVSDPVAYLTHLYPMPFADAGAKTREAHKLYDEYTLLSNLVRESVIETAAGRRALAIRGEGQSEFLAAAGRTLDGKLQALEAAGVPLGVSVSPTTCILAPKSGGVEAIMPPRQTQGVFDQATAAAARRDTVIDKAQADAEAMLVRTAGPQYAELADAVDREYELMWRLSDAEAAGNAAEVERIKSELSEQGRSVESLLEDERISGEARGIVNEARTASARITNEAQADYNQFASLLPKYREQPVIFMSRMLSETFAAVLDNTAVTKIYVPNDTGQVRLTVPRAYKSAEQSQEDAKKKKKEKPDLPSISERARSEAEHL